MRSLLGAAAFFAATMQMDDRPNYRERSKAPPLNLKGALDPKPKGKRGKRRLKGRTPSTDDRAGSSTGETV